jgi:ABC-type bacteriocin/lantibiotic exporter with double-glycine peptidase domain
MTPFNRALDGLLNALGRSAQAVAETPSQINDSLVGQGLVHRVLRLDGGQLPVGDMAGLLLQTGDQSWLALVPGDAGWVGLDGTPAPADHAGRAIALQPRVESLREILPFLRRHKGRLLEIMAGGLIVNLLALLFPLFSSFVYDKVLGNGITETLWALALGLGLAIILDFAVRAVRALLMERFAVASEADIDHALFQSLLSGSVTRLPSVGLVLDKYKQILASRDFLSTAYMLSALDIPFLLLFLLVIAMIAGPLVLVPLVIGVLVIGAHMLFAIPVHDYEGQARRAGEQRFALLADTLTAREAIVGARMRDELARRWRRASVRAGEASGRARYWHGLAQSLSLSAGSLAYVAVLVVGAHMIESRTLTLVVLLLTRYREFRQSLAELDRLVPPPPTAEPPRRHGPSRGHLHLVGVGCRLRADGPAALSEVSLKAAPGEIIGLAGHPGAGKTTLLRVLAGIISPDQGGALLDNRPIDRMDACDVSASIGYKPQDPCLFEGSVEDNLRAGNLRAGDRQMATALTVSGLALAMERGELNLSTPVGPRPMPGIGRWPEPMPPICPPSPIHAARVRKSRHRRLTAPTTCGCKTASTTAGIPL